MEVSFEAYTKKGTLPKSYVVFLLKTMVPLGMKKYVFREYDPIYKDFFNEEKAYIKALFESKNALDIEHVGSTAVPSLGGKGVIDVMIGSSKEQIQTIKNTLEKDSYEFRAHGSTPDRLFFVKTLPYQGGQRLVHLHLVEKDSLASKKLVDFRNYLLHNPEALQNYIRIKKEALEIAQGVGEKYRAHKKPFIEGILEKILL